MRANPAASGNASGIEWPSVIAISRSGMSLSLLK
jgi:hypothetical protein